MVFTLTRDAALSEVSVKTTVLFIQGGGEGAHEIDSLLAESLRKALGSEYDVRYPHMTRESDPDMQTWKAQIAKELDALDDDVILVGHSVGGFTILKYLAEEKIEKPIAGVFLLATPVWDQKDWNFADFKLPDDLAAKLSRIPKIFLYHNRDDEIVPFNLLARHAARLPRAKVREGNRGGHQFDSNLSAVASDIRSET